LLLALADIDRIIQIIRQSKTQAEAKQGLMTVECPAAMMQRALGEEGFSVFQQERGVAENYTLTPVQAEAILKMTLGQLVNLEQERLGNQYNELLNEIRGIPPYSGRRRAIQKIIRDDLIEIRDKYADKRRTEITGEELTEVVDKDLIEEETWWSRISHRGYIKRTPVSTYRAKNRWQGNKGARDRGRRSNRACLCSQYARFPAVLLNQGAGLLAAKFISCLNLVARAAAGRLSICSTWIKTNGLPSASRFGLQCRRSLPDHGYSQGLD
jgi:DNA gyrase/topoisomerase IV subunit A